MAVRGEPEGLEGGEAMKSDYESRSTGEHVWLHCSRCPECGKPEDTKTVCKHCGHEYLEEGMGLGWGIFWTVAGIALGLWLLFTVMFWVGEQCDGGKRSFLLEVLRWQWEFVSRMRVW